MNGTHPGTRALRLHRRSLRGHCYFLTAVTFGRRPLFKHRLGAEVAIEAFTSGQLATRFDVHAAVVMPDHIHLCGTLLNGRLSGVMNSLKGYVGYRLRTLGFTGRVWQRGFHDHALRSDEDYRTMVRYVLLNPVRAGLCDDLDTYPFWFCRHDIGATGQLAVSA